MSLIEQNLVSAVQAGQKANVRIDTGGPTHAALIIRYRSGLSVLASDATLKADLTNIKVIRDGHEHWDLSAAELIMMNDYYGLPRSTGNLPIFFARPEMLAREEEDNLAFGTADVKSARVEITLAGAAVNPDLQVFSVPILGAPRSHGQMLEVSSRPYPDIAAATSETYTNLVDGEQGRLLKSLHFNTAAINNYKIEIRNRGAKATYTEGDLDLHNLDAEMKGHKTGGYVAQAGYTHIQFAGERQSNMLPTAVDEIRMTVAFNAAAAGLSVLREQVVGNPLAKA